MARTMINSNQVKIITEQLAAVKLLLSRIDKAASDKLIEMMLPAGRIFVTGQGRSGLVAQCLATRLTQMGLNVNIPGNATCQRVGQGDLLIAISCRGTTITTVDYARIARQAGAKVAALTAFDKSEIAGMADHVLLIPSDDEDIRNKCGYIIGPNNNTLFEEAALLYVDGLVYMLIKRKGISEDVMNQQHTNLE